ncbi:MAG: CPBP family intramembrane metalloprotease [Candidatus Methanomethylophilaceae archaeon]|nr:CPBP family intramembrane metalloprotease [Candidatus Methanomethylophilaceae archaeon]
MSCGRCDECRARGDNFCVYCGEYLTLSPRSGCGRCDECARNGDSFCKYCGKKLIKEENPFLVIGFVIGMLTAVVLSCLMVFEYFVALWGIPQVWPNLPEYGSTLIVVVPLIIDVVSFNGVLSQIYYLLLILAVTVSLGLLFYKAAKPIQKLSKGDNKTVRNTAFFEMPVLFAVLYIWEMIFFLVLESMGVEIGGLPDREMWKWMYELLEASVWEEVITRILLIGLPTVLIALFYHKEGKKSWRYLFGGSGFDKTALVLIFFSALIFGAGHLNNWGWWKFFPTFIFGLIAGYLFCKYGVYATIMMHFLTDYLSAESWFFGSEYTILTGLTILMLSFVCIPYTYIYVKKMVVGMRDIIRGQDKET